MVWTPPKPIKFSAPKVDKKTAATMNKVKRGGFQKVSDSVRERNMASPAKSLEARADLLNAQRLAQKNDFQTDLAHKVAAAENSMSSDASDTGMPKTNASLQNLGAGKPYGSSR